MTLLGKQPTFYKCRESAVGERFAFVPPLLYVWRGGKLPQTVAAMVSCGVLEVLNGVPSVGLDVTEIHDEWFAPPRPEPVQESLLEMEAVLDRSGLTLPQLRVARAQLGFPAPDAFTGGASAEAPDAVSRPT